MGHLWRARAARTGYFRWESQWGESTVPHTQTKKNIGFDLHIALILIATGSAVAITTWLLRTSRFASIENRTEELGPELYSELAPALLMEQILIIIGAIFVLSGVLFLLARRIFPRRND